MKHSKIVKDFQINELNRILPMVRETIKKHRRLLELYPIIAGKKELLDKSKKLLKNIDAILDSDLEELKESKCKLKISKSKQEKMFRAISSEINEIINEKDELEAQWEFETNLYTAILSSLDIDLENDEIEKEFLEEYVYLSSQIKPIRFKEEDFFRKLLHDQFPNIPESIIIGTDIKLNDIDFFKYF